MTSPRPRGYLPRHLTRTAAPKRTRSRARRPLVVLGGVIALTMAGTGSALAAPPALPANADALEQTFQPAFDYDTDGCYPTPAIGPDGTIAPGLNTTGARQRRVAVTPSIWTTPTATARSKCNNGWCAIMYGLYFEKDQAVAGSGLGGHRHDWEHVVVWVQDNEARYVVHLRPRRDSTSTSQ